MANKTQHDAFLRVHDARLGSAVEATDTFRSKLRAELICWIAAIDADQAVADIERAQRNAAVREHDEEVLRELKGEI